MATTCLKSMKTFSVAELYAAEQMQEAARLHARAVRTRQRRQNWRANGLCTNCGSSASSGRKTCEICRSRARTRWRNELPFRLFYNLCFRCGAPKGERATKWHCRACADFRAERERRKRAAAHIMRLIFLVLVIGSGAGAFAQHGIKLTWTASSTTGITQYSVWRSTTSGNGNCNWVSENGGSPCPYTELVTGVACCSYLDTTVINGTTYYYVVADWAPAPTAATATATLSNSSSVCAGSLECVSAVTLGSGGSGYDYGIGWPNDAGFVLNGGGYTSQAVTPSCSNWNGTAYVGSIQSCGPMCVLGAGACSGFSGAGYTSVPTITATTGPLDMGQMYPAVPGSGVTPAAFSAEAYATAGNFTPNPPTGLTVALTSGNGVLNWTAGSSATSYSIFRSTSGTPCTNGSTALATGISSVSYTDSTVVPGVNYFYQVISVNGSGSSSCTSASELVVPPTYPVWSGL